MKRLIAIANRHARRRYRTRTDAALHLIALLRQRHVQYDVVVFIPNGGAAIGYYIAQALKIKHLAPCLVVKIASRADPRFGIGAITELGIPIINHNALHALSVSKDEQHEQTTAALRKQRYLMSCLGRHSGARDNPPRRYLIVDDGLASGYTMLAAYQSILARGARIAHCAAPVSSEYGAELLNEEGATLLTPYIETAPIFLLDAYYMCFPGMRSAESLRYLRAYKTGHRPCLEPGVGQTRRIAGVLPSGCSFIKRVP
jgi:predicted phosphoribosyltransferase